MTSTPEQHTGHPGLLSTELVNGVTHGVGLGLSIAGLAVLIVLASRYGEPIHIVACAVYGATLTLLYLASTVYHSVQHTRAKRVLRIIDHSAIFLLIAGTYTPFALVVLEGTTGWCVFGVIWGLALVGVVLKLFLTGRFRVASVLVYVGMGWLALFIFEPLAERIGSGGIIWLLAGGIAYTGGLVFYGWKSLPHHHAIWHLFVMAGSTCHFFAVMLHVLPLD
ncbi:MAG: hemolysin III family protein [bacterium]|nr:hemolysin III family protein [bacterium]